MNGQTLSEGFVPLSGGATEVYNSSGLAYYRTADWLGSSRLASAPARTVYYDGAYAPYGGNHAEVGTQDRNFTGQNQDTISSGPYPLYDFLYREYHPTWGRWESPDPVQGCVNFPQGQNLYAYVKDDPTNLTDPNGDLLPLPVCDPCDPWLQWDCGGMPPLPCDATIDPSCLPSGGGGGGGGSGSQAPPLAGQCNCILTMGTIRLLGCSYTCFCTGAGGPAIAMYKRCAWGDPEAYKLCPATVKATNVTPGLRFPVLVITDPPTFCLGPPTKPQPGPKPQ
jgi:RHS repeat-associated protein